MPLEAEPLHVHLDAVGGAAGDMFVAALLDALPHLRPRVFADLAAVLPASCGRPVLVPGTSGGIAVTRFGLDGPEPEVAREHGHGHEHAHAAGHDHGHSHGHGHDHPHGHDHSHDHAHGHDHPHSHDAPSGPARIVRFPEIAAMIAAADLAPGTGAAAIAILRRLAEAESRMHAVPLDDVHFHELADWDSLMDVVAAGSLIAALPNATWSVSDLPRGRGLVRTAHGLLPVPAPATAAILGRFSWRDDGIGGERVTPTGAAILAHLIDPDTPHPAAGRLGATGTGAGTRTLPGMPNILRALVFTAAQEAAPADDDEVMVVTFDVDDMTGEEIAVAAERLRACDGVIDLTLGARQGKKGRPVTDFRLMVRPAALAAVGERCFLETATLGLRWRAERRICLPRGAAAVVVDGRTLAVKRAERPDGRTTVKVENDSLAPIDGLGARRRAQRAAENDAEETDA
ncbi:nickel pincer cofactor biosynthesis protein LarC [Siculibacillus lacustris]|nr:LarC family nickel insertion protein [Siculibacillus lacustris]